MKILLADDHPMVREGLKLLLKRLDTDVFIIEAHDYPDAMRSAAAHEDLGLVVLDRSMPGMDSHGGLRALRQHIPDTPIVVLSASEDPAHVWESLESGARSYIPALLITGDTSPERLREAQTSGYYLLHKPVHPLQLRIALAKTFHQSKKTLVL